MAALGSARRTARKISALMAVAAGGGSGDHQASRPVSHDGSEPAWGRSGQVSMHQLNSTEIELPSLSTQDALMMLAMYLSAIIHDYDHRGLTNPFLIQDEDPLAVSCRG